MMFLTVWQHTLLLFTQNPKALPVPEMGHDAEFT